MRAVRADLKMLALLQQILRPGGHVFFFGRLGIGAKLLVPPQLEILGEEPLVVSLQSALLKLRKRC